MLGNNHCDAACNIADCGYDHGVCSCPLDSSLCDGLSLACRYGNYNQSGGCADEFEVRSALYTQILQRDFFARVNSDGPLYCDKSLRKEAFTRGECIPACNTEAALFSMGMCATNLASHCAVGWGTANDECFQCDTLQHFGQCVDQCPSGTEVVTVFSQMCANLTSVSTKDSPDQLYVREDARAVAVREGPLFFRLLDALAAAWEAYTVISLIGSEVTFDISMADPMRNIDYLTTWALPDILASGRWLELTIESLPCSAEARPGCSEGFTSLLLRRAPTSLLTSRRLIFINVIFTTGSYFFDTIQACPPRNSEKLLEDASFALRKCEQFVDFTLFVVGTSGTLIFEVSPTQNVRFEDIALRFKSIITVASGTLRLIDTHFTNVITTDAVILQTNECLSLEKSCGSVSYQGGTVSYLNNWREFGAGFTPFLSVRFLFSLRLVGVEFELCFASVALLSVRDSREFVITNCAFRSNVVFGSLLSIDSTTAIETLPFQLSNSLFALNYSKGPLLVLSFKNAPRNVNINDCIFEGNAGAAIDVTFTGVLTSNSSLKILATSFLSNSDFQELLKVQNFNTATISASEFRGNGNQQDGESVLKRFLDDPGTLASNPPALRRVKCASLARLLRSSSALIENATVTDNRCDAGGTGIIFQGIKEQKLVLTTALFARNVGIGTTATALHLSEGTMAEVRNLTAEDNTQSGAGVISLRAAVQLLIFDSLFQRNHGEQKSCISSLGALDIKILRCRFRNNEALLGDGAAVALSASQLQASVLTLEIRDSTFFGNYAQRGSAIGVLAEVTKITVTLVLVNSTFHSNRASLAGSSLYVGSDSNVIASIEGCEFAYEHSASGAIDLQQALGTITISRSVFGLNSGRDCSALCIDSGPLSIVRLEEVEFTDNEDCAIAKLNQQVVSILQTSRCLFQRNPVAANLHYTTWEDSFSVFRNSTSTAVIVSLCAVTLVGAEFEGNESPASGGALSVSESALQCTECLFQGNAAANGGAISSLRQSSLLLLSCLFKGNIAGDQGAAVYAHSSSVTVNSSIFLENIAEISGTIAVLGSLVTLHRSGFAGNFAPRTSGLSLMLDSIARVTDCSFLNQTGDEAAFFVLQISSSATISNCTFSNGSGWSAGGVFVSLSNLSISDSTFTDMQAQGGGVVYAVSHGLVTLTGVTVTNARSQLGGVVHIRSGKLKLVNCRFTEFETEAVDAEGVESMEISQNVFERGQGSAVRCMECASVTIAESSFAANRGVNGALSLQSTVDSLVLVTDCSFTGNSADRGGAVFADSVDLRISGCSFVENSALYGGALYLTCSYPGRCGSSVSHSAFERNTAERSGGAVQWLSAPPELFNITYRENKAQQGSDLSSYLANVHLVANDSGDFLSIIHEVTPGELGAVPLIAILHDHYDQLQVLDSSTACRVRVQNESIATLAGVTTARAVHGVVMFAGLIIYAEPKSSVILEVFECNGKLINYSSRLEVRLRGCRPGETASRRMCEPCGSNSYSLDSSKPCQSCPSHCTCLGKTHIIPDPGYWLSAQRSVGVRKCRNPSACVGGREMTCAAGYESHICQVCSNGYYSPGNFRCIKCPSAAIAQGLLVALAALLPISLLVWASVNAPNAASYLRVLVNYFHTLYFAAELDIEWPVAVGGLLQAVRVVAAPFHTAVPFDCWLSIESAYFSKLIIFTVLPVIVALALAVLWLPVFAAARKFTLFIKYSAKSVVVIYFFVYPTLVISSFSVLSCTEVEAGEYWLSFDMRSRCWTAKHLTYTVAIAVLNLFLWIATQPFLHREGFFTQGLVWENWEAAGMLRKATMAAVTVLFVDKIKARVLTLQLLVWIALIAHFMCWPYANRQLNRLEFLSLLVSAITLWCGIIYLSADNASWLVQVVVVSCVSLFPIFWLRELRKALTKHEDSLETLIGKMHYPLKELEFVNMNSLYLLILQTGIREVPALSRKSCEARASQKSRKVHPIS